MDDTERTKCQTCRPITWTHGHLSVARHRWPATDNRKRHRWPFVSSMTLHFKPCRIGL